LQLHDDVDNIICYKKDPAQGNWKIALPKSMVAETVKWFHQVMGHPDEKATERIVEKMILPSATTLTH
jgi:hypothetical protein